MRVIVSESLVRLSMMTTTTMMALIWTVRTRLLYSIATTKMT